MTFQPNPLQPNPLLSVYPWTQAVDAPGSSGSDSAHPALPASGPGMMGRGRVLTSPLISRVKVGGTPGTDCRQVPRVVRQY